MKIQQSTHKSGRPHSYKLGRRGSKYQTRIFKQKDSFLRFALHGVAWCWKSIKTGVSTSKRVFLWVFIVYMGSQAISFSVFSIDLARSSFCIGNGKNSQKSNHMLSATHTSDCNFWPNFWTCQSCKIGWFCCNRKCRYTWQFFVRQEILHIMKLITRHPLSTGIFSGKNLTFQHGFEHRISGLPCGRTTNCVTVTRISKLLFTKRSNKVEIWQYWEKITQVL